MSITPAGRTGIALLVTLGLWLAPLGVSQVKEVGSADSMNAFTFRTQADARLTKWALGRFEQAGLDLPPVSIAFHDDKAPCHGNLGLHRSGTPALIDICGFNWDRFVVAAKKTVLHELGHAWADHTLTEEVRESFLRARGLTTWGDRETPWEARGTEQAAEIIAWALMDDGPFITEMSNAQPADLARGYLELTGNLPLREARDQSNAATRRRQDVSGNSAET